MLTACCIWTTLLCCICSPSLLVYYILLFCSNNIYFEAPEVSQTTEKILSLVEERSFTHPILHGSVEGIRVLSHKQTTHSKHVKRYQQQNSGRTDLPPSILCSRRRHQVSNPSAPNVPDFPRYGESPGDGNNKSVDFFLGDSQNESVRFSEQDRIADSPTLQTNYQPLTSKDARSTPATQRRSTMFPWKNFSETLNNFHDMTSKSDGECGMSRKQLIHKSISFQSIQKHPDGMLTIHQTSESETSLPPEADEEQLLFGKKWTLDNSIEGTKNNSLSLLQHLPSSSNFDSSFRCKYFCFKTLTLNMTCDINIITWFTVIFSRLKGLIV